MCAHVRRTELCIILCHDRTRSMQFVGATISPEISYEEVAYRLSVVIYRAGQKSMPLLKYQKKCININRSYIFFHWHTLFAMKSSLKILSHLKHVATATLLCEIILDSKTSTLGTVLLKDELARDLTYGTQQLLWQTQVTIIQFIDFDSEIDECQTSVVTDRHHHWLDIILVWRKRFVPTSFFFVATDVFIQSFCEFFIAANVNRFLSVNIRSVRQFVIRSKLHSYLF